MLTNQYDVIVVGAGAAGLMCAMTAAKRGKKILLLEHASRPGNKILISGGGRCNFTNVYTSPQNYISQNPHFCKSALSRFTPQDFISLVEQYHIAYYEKKLGQLFCKNSSKEILQMLLAECDRYQVRIQLNCVIRLVDYSNHQYIVDTDQEKLTCQSLVIATGGLSWPQLKVSDFGYQMAKQFAVPLIEPRPGLVPVLLTEPTDKNFLALTGLSCLVEVSIGRIKFLENILVTHQGLSGPAILQISNYLKTGDTFYLNFFPEKDLLQLFIKAKLNHPQMYLKNYLVKLLPDRLAYLLCEQSGFADQPLLQFSNVQLEVIAKQFQHWPILFQESEDYDKAEVTLGGVDTNALSSKTFEVKHRPGLYFIGEVVDVTGQLGGFNFQWAWASGFCAGEHV